MMAMLPPDIQKKLLDAGCDDQDAAALVDLQERLRIYRPGESKVGVLGRIDSHCDKRENSTTAFSAASFIGGLGTIAFAVNELNQDAVAQLIRNAAEAGITVDATFGLGGVLVGGSGLLLRRVITLRRRRKVISECALMLIEAAK
jgi:hypothetical protein